MVLRIFGKHDGDNFAVKSIAIEEEGNTVLVSLKGEGLSDFLPYFDELKLNALVSLNIPDENCGRFFVEYGKIFKGKGLREIVVYNNGEKEFNQKKNKINFFQNNLKEKDNFYSFKYYGNSRCESIKTGKVEIKKTGDYSFLYQGKNSCLVCDIDSFYLLKKIKNHNVAVINFNRIILPNEINALTDICNSMSAEEKTLVLTGFGEEIKKTEKLIKNYILLSDGVLSINR